jgi:hypothetical protein
MYGFFKLLVGVEPTNLRLLRLTSADCVSVNENQRKAAVQAPRYDGTNPMDLEDWLELQPRRFFMLGLEPETYMQRNYFGEISIWRTNA